MPSIGNISSLLWLLLIVPAVLLLYRTRNWRKQVTKQLGDERLVRQLTGERDEKGTLLRNLLPLIAMALLAIALIDIRKPESTEKITLNGSDLMIALDVSNSMMARDIQPNRLEKAKLVIGKLIDGLEGNRLGLVVFAGNAYLQMPLTSDAAAARLFLSSIGPDLVPLQGTNISEALQLCLRSFNPEEKKYRSVLLISDGEDHDDAAIATAAELKKNGVVVHTIGVGSPAGSPLTDPATNEAKRDDQGNMVITKLNEKELKDIAAATNGSYLLLNEADAAVSAITRQLSNLEKRPVTDTSLTNFRSYYWVFVLLAMALLIVPMFISERKRQQKSLQVMMPLLFLLFTTTIANAQPEREALRKGNEAYKQQRYDLAKLQYEDALNKDKNSPVARFNLGNAQFKIGKFGEAAQQYEALAAEGKDRSIKAKSLYNKGVSLVKDKKLEQAIEAFKQSLKMDASDEETRENLQKALNELKQQQKQQQQQQQDKKNKDQKPPEDKKDQQQKDPKQDQQQEQPQPKMSKEDAEQKLQALRQEEKKLQQRLNQKQKMNVKQPEKDW